MADDVAITAGSGTTIATDQAAGGEHYQQIKLVDGTADSTTVIAAGGGVEANALRVTIANDSTGVISIDDGGNVITVDGTVTANLGATDNAVLDAIQAAVETLDNCISGSEAQVDVVSSALPTGAATEATLSTLDGKVTACDTGSVTVGAALPAGDNNIGNVDIASIAAGDNNIGNVDVASIAAGDNNIGNVDIATVPAPLNVVGGGAEATALRVTLANDSTGVVTVDDGGGALTVDGTVTANLSATDNTVLDNIDTNTTGLAGCVGGSELQVDVVGALPAGSNAIGKLAANDGVDIGDVDVTSCDGIAAEGAALGNGILVQGDDGTDRHNLQTDASGFLKMSIEADNVGIGGGTQYTEGDTDATITGTAILWEDGSDTLATASAASPLPVEVITGGGTGGTSSADDDDFTAGSTNGTPAMGVYESSPTSVTDGDMGHIGITTDRRVKCLADLGATDNAVLDAIQAAVETIDDCISGSEAQVDVVAALPAGDNNIGNVDIVTVPAPLDATGGGTEAAALRVTIANDSTGVLTVDDGGGTLTVDGTVDLGATDNAVLDSIATNTTGLNNCVGGSELQVDVVSSALPTGAATESTLATLDGKVTACNTGDVTIGAALPAGANAIGKLSANSGVDIGDVDVTSVVPGTGATNLGKAEDAAHSSGDVGVMALAIRDDTCDARSGAENDYEPLHTDSVGRLWTDPQGNIAHDGADSGNPVKIGGKAISAAPTAVAANDRSDIYTDLYGQLLVNTTHINHWSAAGTYTSAQTNTSLKAATASVSHYITDVMVTNDSTAAITVALLDGSGGTSMLGTQKVPTSGGFVLNLRTPIKLTANTALCLTTTGTSNFAVFVSGYTAA